jgi:hypothetical protein
MVRWSQVDASSETSTHTGDPCLAALCIRALSIEARRGFAMTKATISAEAEYPLIPSHIEVQGLKDQAATAEHMIARKLYEIRALRRKKAELGRSIAKLQQQMKRVG